LQVKLIGAGFGVAAAVGADLISYLPLLNLAADVTSKETESVLVYASINLIIVRFAFLLSMNLIDLNAISVCARMIFVGAVGMLGLSTMNKDLAMIPSIVSYTLGWGWVGLIGWNILRIADTNLGTYVGFIQSTAAVGSLSGPLILSIVYNLADFRTLCLISGVSLILAMFLLIFSETTVRESQSG
jgi:hypothetical protein